MDVGAEDKIEQDIEDEEIVITREGFTIGTLSATSSIILITIIIILTIFLIGLIFYVIISLKANNVARAEYENKLDLEAFSKGNSPDIYFVKQKRRYVAGYGKQKEQTAPPPASDNDNYENVI